jgi:hypothetical protein
MERFTFSHLQTSAMVSTLHTLNATQKAIDVRQTPSGSIILTVYGDRLCLIYSIAPDGYVRAMQEVPA